MSNNNDNNPDTLLDNLDLNLDGDFEFEDGDLDKLLGNAGDLEGIGDLPDGDTPDGLGPPSSNAQNRQSLNLNTLLQQEANPQHNISGQNGESQGGNNSSDHILADLDSAVLGDSDIINGDFSGNLRDTFDVNPLPLNQGDYNQGGGGGSDMNQKERVMDQQQLQLQQQMQQLQLQEQPSHMQMKNLNQHQQQNNPGISSPPQMHVQMQMQQQQQQHAEQTPQMMSNDALEAKKQELLGMLGQLQFQKQQQQQQQQKMQAQRMMGSPQDVYAQPKPNMFLQGNLNTTRPAVSSVSSGESALSSFLRSGGRGEEGQVGAASALNRLPGQAPLGSGGMGPGGNVSWGSNAESTSRTGVNKSAINALLRQNASDGHLLRRSALGMKKGSMSNTSRDNLLYGGLKRSTSRQGTLQRTGSRDGLARRGSRDGLARRGSRDGLARKGSRDNLLTRKGSRDTLVRSTSSSHRLNTKHRFGVSASMPYAMHQRNQMGSPTQFGGGGGQQNAQW